MMSNSIDFDFDSKTMDVLSTFMNGMISENSPVSLVGPDVMKRIGRYYMIECRLSEFKTQIQGFKVNNPLTGRVITIGSTVFNRLLKTGTIQYCIGSCKTKKSMVDGGICRGCGDQLYHFRSGVCCFCRDRRPMLKVGVVYYTYLDQYGLDYCWRSYCPQCISRGHLEITQSAIHGGSQSSPLEFHVPGHFMGRPFPLYRWRHH